MIKFWAFITLLSSYAMTCWALSDVKTGQSVEQKELLAQGKTLLYVTKDCRHCKNQLKKLRACPDLSLVVVVVEHESYAQELSRDLPHSIKVFFERSRPDHLTATPWTINTQEKYFGVRSICPKVAQR